MPPKQKSTFERLKQERSQLRRTFTKIFNEASLFLKKSTLTDEEIARVKASSELLNATFEKTRTMERELKSIVLDDIKGETKQKEFFDESDSVMIDNKESDNECHMSLRMIDSVQTFGVLQTYRKAAKYSPCTNIKAR